MQTGLLVSYKQRLLRWYLDSSLDSADVWPLVAAAVQMSEEGQGEKIRRGEVGGRGTGVSLLKGNVSKRTQTARSCQAINKVREAHLSGSKTFQLSTLPYLFSVKQTSMQTILSK